MSPKNFKANDFKILAPAIYSYAFSDALAKKILTKAKDISDSNWTRSKESSYKTTVRTSSQIIISETLSELEHEIRKEIAPCINHYATEMKYPVTQDEGMALLKYKEKVGKYDFHYDDSIDKYRKFSLLIYLNPSEYIGGETYFKFFDCKVKPERPELVLFPSNFAYTHSALPTDSGIKYVIVSWLNDLPKGYGSDFLIQCIVRNNQNNK